MKRVFAIIFSLLLLTACAKQTTVPETVPAPEQTKVEEAPVTVEDLIVPETEFSDIAVEKEETPPSADAPAPYTVEVIEGLVEDAVSYDFEIPVFEYPGNDVIRAHYDQLVSSMTGFTKEVVYANAMERFCVASVHGYVSSVTLNDEILAVTYVFECVYSDTDEATQETRIDRFDITTGELLELFDVE